MSMFTKRFWKEAAERAVKTAAQAAILVIGQDVAGFNVFGADLANIAGFAAGGAVLSILTSMASVRVGGEGPSLV